MLDKIVKNTIYYFQSILSLLLTVDESLRDNEISN